MKRRGGNNLLVGVLLPGLCAWVLATGSPVAAKPPLNDLVEVLHYPTDTGLLADRFYPLGFSNKGHLAYIKVHADEAVGCLLWRFVILNLVNDETVAEIVWESFEEQECFEESEGLGAVLAAHGNDMMALARRHGVVIKPLTKLEPFPKKESADQFTIRLENLPPVRPDSSTVNRPIAVLLETHKRGRKRIGQLEAIEMDGIPFIYGHRAVGYLASPFEPRIAVVVRQDMRGYEGPPNVASFRLFGASLRSGFAHPDLESLLAACGHLGLVAPQSDSPGRWCQAGKAISAAPIRTQPDPCRGWQPQFCKLIGAPTLTRVLALRETECPQWVFRPEISEWTFGSESQAKATAKKLAASKHNADLKQVHRLWREGTRVFLAKAGAFTHWDRFELLMSNLGVKENLCSHR